MSLKTRISHLENGRSGIQPPEGYPHDWPWEAPWFVVLNADDLPRCEAKRQHWKKEIERDKARGRTIWGFNFLHPEPDSTNIDKVQA